MNITDKPWFKLNPNDFRTQWWRSSHIIDANSAKIFKSDNEAICYFIIQDSNMCGEYWRVSTWYNNDPNRYSTVLGKTNWNFSSSLIQMKENDIIITFLQPYRVSVGKHSWKYKFGCQDSEGNLFWFFKGKPNNDRQIAFQIFAQLTNYCQDKNLKPFIIKK